MGVRLFWNSGEIVTPQLHLIEAAPVAVLLLLSAALAVGAGPAADYLGLAGHSLSSPQTYIDAVLGTGSLSHSLHETGVIEVIEGIGGIGETGGIGR